MLDTFITSFRLKNTYRTNTIIYSIRCLPIIGKLLPASLYGSGGLKTFANVISVLWEIAGTFIGKILYMLLMIMLMLAVYDTEPSDTYLHIFTALTVAGGLTNTYMFNPTKDKYCDNGHGRQEVRHIKLLLFHDKGGGGLPASHHHAGMVPRRASVDIRTDALFRSSCKDGFHRLRHMEIQG